MSFKKFYLVPNLVIVLLFVSLISVGQEMPKQAYIMLDSLNKKFAVKSFTLNTKDLYQIDKKIEVFNVSLRQGQVLMVLSVLPDFTSKENWKKIELSQIERQLLSNYDISKFALEVASPKGLSFSNANTFNIGLIKTVDNDLYASTFCLIQRFNVYDFQPPLSPSQKGINLGGNKVKVKDIENAYKKTYPKHSFPMNPENDHSILFDEELLENYYLSKKFSLKGDTAYQFWTLTDWQVKDGWNIQRGIDRFVFIPKIGIVGGSYDFWFAFKPWRANYSIKGLPVSAEKVWNNIVDDKVILADEFK